MIFSQPQQGKIAAMLICAGALIDLAAGLAVEKGDNVVGAADVLTIQTYNGVTAAADDVFCRPAVTAAGSQLIGQLQYLQQHFNLQTQRVDVAQPNSWWLADELQAGAVTSSVVAVCGGARGWLM